MVTAKEFIAKELTMLPFRRSLYDKVLKQDIWS